MYTVDTVSFDEDLAQAKMKLESPMHRCDVVLVGRREESKKRTEEERREDLRGLTHDDFHFNNRSLLNTLELFYL